MNRCDEITMDIVNLRRSEGRTLDTSGRFDRVALMKPQPPPATMSIKRRAQIKIDASDLSSSVRVAPLPLERRLLLAFGLSLLESPLFFC